MTSKEFEDLKESPSTIDILKWIIKELKEGGTKRRTIIALVSEIYKVV